MLAGWLAITIQSKPAPTWNVHVASLQVALDLFLLQIGDTQTGVFVTVKHLL